MSEIKEQLIEAAQKTFALYGYKKTTLDDIARLTGKCKTSVYYYFNNKEELLTSVIEKEISDIINALRQTVNQQDDPLLKLSLFVKMRIKLTAKAKVLKETTINEQIRNLPFIEASTQKFAQEKLTILKSILTEGILLSKIKPMNTELAALAIETALKGIDATWDDSDLKIDSEVQIDNMVHLLFYGLALDVAKETL